MDDHQRDAEAELRQSLRLSDASPSPLAADPQRLARQAIRSQAAAREYAERHLLRAEQTIQDLSAKLQAVRREKGIALEAPRTALDALAQAERGRRAAEAALINEKAAGERIQRELQEARATVYDLRAKVGLAHQTIAALQMELDEERQARTAAEEERPARTTPVADEIENARIEQPVRRRRGRPPGGRDGSAPRSVAGNSYADDQAPVQWWIKSWTPKT